MKGDVSRLREDIMFDADLRGRRFVFHSTWGLFSPTEVDEGSRLLLDHIEVRPDDISLDIGCGYGALGIPIAKFSPAGEVHMIDKDFVAVAYAKKNAAMNDAKNCKVYLSNGFSAVPDIKFDLIFSKSSRESGQGIFMDPLGRREKTSEAGRKDLCRDHFRPARVH